VATDDGDRHRGGGYRTGGFIARRRLIGAAAMPLGLALAPSASARQAGPNPQAGRLAPTPRQSRGPYYPPDPPRDAGNDLIVERDGQRARGEPVLLSGHVTDTAGRPLAGTLVELWQCNAAGRYHHPRDDSAAPIDPLFRAYGRMVAAAGGAWQFRTIRPVPYPGRTPHIHLQFTTPAGVQWVTQLYVRGEPGNAGDGLLARLAPADRERLLADFVATSDGGWRASFEAVIPA
jgi:protocatechuate 3,4-dioxygenase beta subunit